MTRLRTVSTHSEPPRVALRGTLGAIVADLSGLRFIVFAAFAALILSIATHIVALVVFPALVALELLFSRRTVTTLTFGADGVALQSYGFWRAFIRHAQLSHFDVQADDKANWFLRLHKTEGNPTILAHSRRMDDVIGWKWQIDAAMAAVRRPSARARVRELGRRSDDRERWLERLKAVKIDSSSYRARTLSEDDLRLALEDPTCPADERWAAAWLLARSNPEAKLRISEVAREVARPQFREALDALSSDDEMDDEQAAEWMDRVRPT